MKKIRPLIIITAVLALILVVFSMGTLDYDLSRAIINKHSLFGEFFNLFGELPATLGMTMGVFIIYAARKREKLGWNILTHVLSLPFFLLFLWFSLFAPVRYVFEFNPDGVPALAGTLVTIAAVLLFALAIWWANFKADVEKVRKFKKVGIFFIVVIVAEMVLVNVVKILWARPRMRSMESFDQFKYWYQISGPNTGEEFKSFPSGHTANGFAMILWSLFFPPGSKRNKFVAFALVWGVCVALSRVILGAHFLTDVTMGGYITLLLFYVLKPLFVKEEIL